MLIDGGDGFHDGVEGFLLVDEHFLLLFKVGSKVVEFSEGSYDGFF